MRNVSVFFGSMALYYSSLFSIGVFDHGRAVQAAQREDWQTAQSALQQLLVNDPENIEVLYDLGVSSYKMKQFDTARVYFDQVIHRKDASLEMQERAYFNLGNAAVAQEKLHEAIEQYEAALAINQDNERARHNLELVKKMLEQQKQQEQQQKQDQKKQKKSGASDKNNDQQKNDQQHNDQQKSENQDRQDSNKDKSPSDQKNGQGDTQHGQEQSSSDQSDSLGQDQQSGNQGQKQNQQAGGRNKQQDTAGGAPHQQEQSAQNRNTSGSGEQQDKAGKEQPQQHARGTGHEKESPTTEQQDKQVQQNNGPQDQNRTKGAYAAAPDANGHRKPITQQDRLLAKIMAEQEQADAHVNKHVIRQAVNKRASGNHGKNRW